MKIEKSGVIYRIYNKVNGKSYVGRTFDYNRRIYEHFNGYSRSSALWLAVCKYGVDSFKSEILENNVPVELLSKMEILNIRFWNSVAPNGYNLTSGGDGMFVVADEVREKFSAWQRGRRLSIEHRQKISENHGSKRYAAWNKGKKLSEEHKRKLSDSHKGKLLSESHKAKISKALKGNTRGRGNKGKCYTKKV